VTRYYSVQTITYHKPVKQQVDYQYNLGLSFRTFITTKS